jgi:hypothetical protein
LRKKKRNLKENFHIYVGKELCGEPWKTITWEKFGKTVKRMWKKCGKKYCEKSVEKL